MLLLCRSAESSSLRTAPASPAAAAGGGGGGGGGGGEDAFRSAPLSPQLIALRAMAEDPFGAAATGGGRPTAAEGAPGSRRRSDAGEAAVAEIRAQLEGFRSEPVHPQVSIGWGWGWGWGWG